METEFIQEFVPLLIFLVSFIIIYLSLKKLEIPGTNWTHAILSFLISFVLISATKAVEFSSYIIPWFTVVAVGLFLTLVLFCFVEGKFPKYFAWIAFVLTIIVLIWAMFEAFPVLDNMMPGTSDSGLSTGLENFKDWIYSDTTKGSAIFIVVAGLVGFIVTKK